MTTSAVTGVFPFELGPINKGQSVSPVVERIDLASPKEGAKGAPKLKLDGGAYLDVATKVQPLPAAGNLNVQGLYSALSTGMKQGFVAPGHKRMVDKLQEMEKPNSSVTAGEMMATIVSATGEAALGDVMAKVSNKVAESLQTIVVKQS
jgi:hypothetical protein